MIYLLFILRVLALCYADNTKPNDSENYVQKEYQASREDPIGHALSRSGIVPTDSIQMRIVKILYLLNHNGYTSTYDYHRQPNFDFDQLSLKQQSDALTDHQLGDYEMDGERTAKEMLGHRSGGACGTAAISFASLLAASGIESERIRIVSTILNDDLQMLCPGLKGEARNPKNGGTSGHEFVMVKLNPSDDQSWTLINTVNDPIRILKNGKLRGKHFSDIKELEVHDQKDRNYSKHLLNVLKVLGELDISELEMTAWNEFPFTGDGLKAEIEIKPIHPPERIAADFPETNEPNGDRPLVHYRKFTIFSVKNINDYPKNNSEQRKNFAASGTIEKNQCRYNCSSIQSDHHYCILVD